MPSLLLIAAVIVAVAVVVGVRAKTHCGRIRAAIAVLVAGLFFAHWNTFLTNRRDLAHLAKDETTLAIWQNVIQMAIARRQWTDAIYLVANVGLVLMVALPLRKRNSPTGDHAARDATERLS